MPQHLSQAVHGSPGGLAGRLYAGQGYNERLTESSPPRNTPFGARVRENAPSPVGGVPALLGSRVNNTKETAFAQQQQEQHQGQQQQYQGEGSSSIPRVLEHASAFRGPTSQQVDDINSPPRVGLQRCSYGASASSSRESAGTGPTRNRKAMVDHSRNVGGMTLSHSLGALGCAGVSRSTAPAAGDTRDDGAPYLRSEIISPNSLLKASRRSPLAVRSRRYELHLLLVLLLVSFDRSTNPSSVQSTSPF